MFPLLRVCHGARRYRATCTVSKASGLEGEDLLVECLAAAPSNHKSSTGINVRTILRARPYITSDVGGMLQPSCLDQLLGQSPSDSHALLGERVLTLQGGIGFPCAALINFRHAMNLHDLLQQTILPACDPR
jgi:hypothetical protein